MARVPYVKKKDCISCAACARTLPSVFRMDDDNLAEVYDPKGADESAIQGAIDICPVSCIYWEE
jgi:ferredoxin